MLRSCDGKDAEQSPRAACLPTLQSHSLAHAERPVNKRASLGSTGRGGMHLRCRYA